MSEACSLAVLECLIQSNGCLRLEDLWSILLTKFSHYPEVLSIIGPTAECLERFILRQPALFRLVEGYVYSTDISDAEPNSPPAYISLTKKNSFDDSLSGGESAATGIRVGVYDPEMQAVKYFQEHLLRKPERWVSVKRLAGHLSQASPSVRAVVGPQSEFINFLRRHPLFFRVQGDLVGLSEQLRNNLSNCPPMNSRKKSRPLSFQGTEEPRRRNSSDKIQLPVYLSTPTSNSTGLKHSGSETEVIALSVEECKALLWLRYLIEMTGEHTMSMSMMLSKLSHAPKCVHGSIGWTQIELTEFLKKYHTIFLFDEITQSIRTRPTKSVDLIIVTRNSTVGENGVLLAQRGCIFCINRLWGIIDLGFHEHVFFDRSLFKHVTDLSKHFQVKETVYFNAVLASKESRAKWRATCVWKETDPLANYLQRLSTKSENVDPTVDENTELQDDPDSGLDNSEDQPNSKTSLKSLFDDVSEAFEHCMNSFASIRLADAWELESKQLSNQQSDDNQSEHLLCDDQSNKPKPSPLLPESRSICSSPVSDMSTLSGVPSITGFGDGCSSVRTSSSVPFSELDVDRPRCSCTYSANPSAYLSQRAHATVATQTLFTGDIMATRLYHEDVGTTL